MQEYKGPTGLSFLLTLNTKLIYITVEKCLKVNPFTFSLMVISAFSYETPIIFLLYWPS